MQYQVFNKKTGELVAWIDTDKGSNIVHKDYDIKVGENLTAEEVADTSLKAIAKFEKISYEQWKKDNEDLVDWRAEVDYESLCLPKRATKGSAGYDFFTPCEIDIPPYSEIKIATGIKCEIKEGYVLELYPRSSLGFKHRLHLNNTVGIIDSDYYNNVKNEGHIMIKMYNPTDKTVTIPEGEAYAQGIFKEFFLADEEEVTTERVGGIGSTNNS